MTTMGKLLKVQGHTQKIRPLKISVGQVLVEPLAVSHSDGGTKTNTSIYNHSHISLSQQHQAVNEQL